MQKTRLESANGVSSKSRDYSLDNIRFLLIFLVVFAHLLEVFRHFWGSALLYKIIYSFHMPAFIFLFGYNVKYSLSRIVFRWCIPYVVFQSIYILFARVVLHAGAAFQYTTPYWLLWYMMVCIFYQLLLPLYDTANRRRQVCFVLGAFLFSLLIGFVDSVGYDMSLSRFFVFQPWFLLGLYCKRNGVFESLSNGGRRRFWVIISVAVIILSVPLLHYAHIPNKLLYGSYSYHNCGGAFWMRAAISLVSFAWILLLFAGVKPYINKRLAILTNIGQNTWPVFLMHGFVVKVAPIYLPGLLCSPVYALLLSCGILVLTGNKTLNKAIYYMCFSWMEKPFLRQSTKP